MEVNANGNIVERECGFRILRREGEFAVLRASPQDATFREGDRLWTCDDLTLGEVGLIEFEGNLLGCDDTHGDERLL